MSDAARFRARMRARERPAQPAPPAEWTIERVPSDWRIADWIEGWKTLRADGWDVVVLLAPDEKTVIGIGCK